MDRAYRSRVSRHGDVYTVREAHGRRHNCHVRLLKLYDGSRTSKAQAVQAHLEPQAWCRYLRGLPRVLPSAGGKAKQSPGVDDYRFKVRWLDGELLKSQLSTSGPPESTESTVYSTVCL